MASVYKRTWSGADGKERVRWVAAYKDQHGRRHNKGFLTRKDAKAFLVLTLGEVARGIHTPELSSITVFEAAQLWLKRGELEQLERSTLRQYRNHVEHHILPLIGAVKLARLSTPVVQAFRDELLETRSRTVARKVLASLKSIVGEAMRRGLVAQNAAQFVAIDTKKRSERKLTVGVDVPSKEEISLLLDRAEGRWRPFFVTAVFTGMRASELRGLVWDACPKGKLGLVFPNGNGNVESHANIAARGFAPLQKAALGEVKYGLHCPRHWFASWAIEQGFPPKRLQALLGHSSIQMTYDVYGHLFTSLEDDHAKFAAGALEILTLAVAVREAAE